MNKTTKYISMILFGSAAWMVCAVALPMNQATDTDGLMAKASNLFIGQAYAKDDESKSDDEGKSDDKSKSDDEDKSKDKSSSSSYDFSTATLVCVSKTSVETTLGITSSSDESKSDDDKSKSDDSKSDDDSSKSDDGKATLCHVPNGNNSNPQTLSVASSAVDSHLNQHDGDYLGACNSSNDDDKSKSDDDDKSKDSESKSDDSTTTTSTTVDALATCTAVGQDGADAGVWVPATAVGDSAALTAYIDEVLVGGSTPSTPDSSLESYREIRGE